MSSIRDRLAAKQVRTTSVSVPIETPDPKVVEEVTVARALVFGAGMGKQDPKSLEHAEGVLAEAEKKLAQWSVEVSFQAIKSADFEALVNAATDKNGKTQEELLLPALAAACAVDVDLQDEDWWGTQLATPAWSAGETFALLDALRAVNGNGAQLSSVGFPKG